MATLTDLDGAYPTDVTWQWQGQGEDVTDCLRSPSLWLTPDDLEGGISGTYTPPTAEDIGKCLRATASYTDPQGSDTAMSVRR